MAVNYRIPKTQTVALVRSLGGPVEFVDDYPVPIPARNEVLAKVLYTGVCQSDLHTKSGTASGPDGKPITAIKLPHIGGHEGVGRIVALGPGLPSSRDPNVRLGALVGIRFASRICHRCTHCLSAQEQHCPNATNHLHHEDGAFQEYIALDAAHLALLPPDSDPKVMGPVLCAGLTAYKAVRNAALKPGDILVVVGAGGGLGNFAVQFGLAHGARVIAVDTGAAKRADLEALGAQFVDFMATPDTVKEVLALTGGEGAHAVVVAAGSAKAFAAAADMLRVRGVLCVCGIPPGGGRIETSVAAIAIKGLRIQGNLVGNMAECLEAVEMVRSGRVRPKVLVRGFRELGDVYGMLERGDVAGRAVLRVGEDPGPELGLGDRRSRL